MFSNTIHEFELFHLFYRDSCTTQYGKPLQEKKANCKRAFFLWTTRHCVTGGKLCKLFLEMRHHFKARIQWTFFAFGLYNVPEESWQSHIAILPSNVKYIFGRPRIQISQRVCLFYALFAFITLLRRRAKLGVLHEFQIRFSFTPPHILLKSFESYAGSKIFKQVVNLVLQLECKIWYLQKNSVKLVKHAFVGMCDVILCPMDKTAVYLSFA